LLPSGAELDGAGEDAEVGAALIVAVGGDELGLDVEGEGFDCAGEAIVGLGEAADGCHGRVPFSDRAAPIATSMGVVRPGTIGSASEGLERSGRRRAPAFLLRD